jgi:hypothetical protein
MLAGLRTLIQPVFDTTEPASMCEDGRAVLGDVFVQQDASLGIAQQARQSSLPVQEWETAQIQVEGVPKANRGHRFGPVPYM